MTMIDDLRKRRLFRSSNSPHRCHAVARIARMQIPVLLFLLALTAPLAVASSCTSLIPIAPGPAPYVKDPSPADCGSMLIEDDPNVPLQGHTPVLLIHGICLPAVGCHDSSLTGGDLDVYFSNLISFLSRYPGFSNQFKIYRFQYKSNQYRIYDVGRSLRNWLDDEIKLNPAFDTPVLSYRS